MLPFQDHCQMQVQLREFEKLQLLKMLEHLEPALIFIFGLRKNKVFNLGDFDNF